jgi:SAM-dependent methyltransferase
MPKPIRSYTSVSGSPGLFHEIGVLWKRTRRATDLMPDEISKLLKIIRDAERAVEESTGMRIIGKDVLEIGPGQLPRQLAYFGLNNNVIGIDLDVIPMGLDIGGYFNLWRRNGFRRLIKTIGRKLLGFDAKFTRELMRQLNVRRLPRPRMLAMDATKMDFPDASFDFVYSFSVFEHLPDPAAVLRDIVRTLRPGGVVYTHLHLYTSDNGHHDMRITPSFRDDLPYWAHLRPQHQHSIHPFAYINRLRIPQWKEIFENEMPGTVYEHDFSGETHLAELAKLREAGELADYTDEELMTHNLIAIWKKPT